MNNLFKIAWWGLAISALGTLPLGAINVAAMQVSISQGVANAAWFSLGAALVEMLYVRVSVVGINWVRKNATLLRWLDWLAFLVVAALAVSTFLAAGHTNGASKNVLLDNTLHPFVLGMVMSAVNPMQIPFWFGWSTVLFSKGVLVPERRFYNSYIIGIGTGTLAGLAVFVLGGQLLVSKLNNHQKEVQYGIAAVLGITALIFLYKIIAHKGAIDSLESKGVSMHEENP